MEPNPIQKAYIICPCLKARLLIVAAKVGQPLFAMTVGKKFEKK
jgi:hypothetical protein